MADTVLVVDDDSNIREVLHKFFTLKGYQVILAANGEQALELAESEMPKVILLDINMPGIDGMETCKRLRADEKTRLIPIILITAYGATRTEASDAGADDIIYKPFDMDRVIESIENVVKKNLILVVDDQLEDRETFKDILESKGYKVTTAKDGYEAIELVNRGEFNIIFIDVKMAGINGVKTFEGVRKLRPDVPVVMVTGYSVEELVKEAIDKGAYACIYKPLDMEKIMRIIKEVKKK